MKVGRFAVAPLALPAMIALPAPASFVGLSIEEKHNSYGITTYNIYAQFDGGPGDLVTAVAATPNHPLFIQPDTFCPGTFYQHPFGNDKPPNPFLVELFPSLGYDTFVTIGKKTSVGDQTGLSPGWPGFGVCSLKGSHLGWYVTPDDPQGHPDANNRVLLMQLSSIPGNFGLFNGMILVQGESNGVVFSEYLFTGRHCDCFDRIDPCFCFLRDLDGDLDVGITDLLYLLSQWGPSPCGKPDYDNSGSVDQDDLMTLLTSWGPCG